MNRTTIHKKMPDVLRGGRLRYNKPCERCGQMMHNVGSARKYCDDCALLARRVSIAKSESVPAGSTAEFEIECLDPGLEAMVRECLNYGTKRGLGQWRNSGKGRYEWEEL